MALDNPVPTGHISQRFAVSTIVAEPKMFATAEKAYWYSNGNGNFPGARLYAHFHPAVDRAAPRGTPIYASAGGKVSIAKFVDTTSGNKVEVWINGTTAYGHNHMDTIQVRVGQIVKRGDILGTIGTTGYVTGAHTHYYLSVVEKVGLTLRTMLYDPLLFEAGGKYADDPRVQSMYEKEDELVDVARVRPPTIAQIAGGKSLKLFVEPNFQAKYNEVFQDQELNAPYEVEGAPYKHGTGTMTTWLEVGYRNQRRYIPIVNCTLVEPGNKPADCGPAVEAKQQEWEAWNREAQSVIPH